MPRLAAEVGGFELPKRVFVAVDFGAASIRAAHQRGTPEMASGELLRYLAEAVWLPTALLPSAGVSWAPVSDTIAIATLTDGQTSAALDVYFGEHGEIVRIATFRYRDVDGTAVLTPWVGHFGDYQRVNGMMIPMSGDVEWVLPRGPSPYWRGRIVSADHEFAPTVSDIAPAKEFQSLRPVYDPGLSATSVDSRVTSR